MPASIQPHSSAMAWLLDLLHTVIAHLQVQYSKWIIVFICPSQQQRALVNVDRQMQWYDLHIYHSASECMLEAGDA